MAGGQLELNKVRLLVDQTDLRLLPCANEGAGPDLELQVGVVTGVQGVTRCKRGIDPRRHPVSRAGPPEGGLSLDVAKAGRSICHRLPDLLSVNREAAYTH
jgi:hypothetical protein